MHFPSSKAPDVNVVELNPYFNSSTEKLRQDDAHQLPPKTLTQHRLLTHVNVTIIAVFVFAYGVCVTGAIVPELIIGSFPFLSATFLGFSTGRYSPCSAQGQSTGRFEINIPFGSYTYLEVKAIDAMWNTIVGRGLQACLAWASLQLFNIALLRITQEHPVPLPMYNAVAFSTTSASTAIYLWRSIWTGKDWRSKAIMTWLLLSIAHLLTFPTLLDLSTGYVDVQDAFIRLSDSSLKDLTAFSPDQISYNSTVAEFLYGHQNESIFLSGEVFAFSDLIDSNDNWLYEPSGYIKCVPGATYQWGFSTGYIWLTSTITSIWVLGMLVMWCDSLRYGVLWRTGRRLGDYRNILDIAQVLQEKLGEDTCAHSNAELERKVRNLPPIGFEVVTDASGQRGHIRLSENPGGCTALTAPDVEYGSLKRLRRKSQTWPLTES